MQEGNEQEPVVSISIFIYDGGPGSSREAGQAFQYDSLPKDHLIRKIVSDWYQLGLNTKVVNHKTSSILQDYTSTGRDLEQEH